MQVILAFLHHLQVTGCISEFSCPIALHYKKNYPTVNEIDKLDHKFDLLTAHLKEFSEQLWIMSLVLLFVRIKKGQLFPFSGSGSSADNLHDLCSDSTKWEEGKRFEAGTSKEEIEEWLKIFPHSCLFFCFRTVQEKTKRDLCTVDRGRGQQTADKDKGRVEDVVSGLCEQIGHSADGDLVYSVFDPVTVVEMGVHDDVDQVNKVGLSTNIIDDLCSGEREISGKGQEKADEANRKQKRDGSVPKIKMSVLKAFSE